MAVAQNGLAYAGNPFDIDRYECVRKIAAAILADHTLADPQRIENLFAQEVGYATPKVDVRGVVFRDQALLLVKEREDGRWTLPGGWADVNESPSEAVAREIFEESGYRTAGDQTAGRLRPGEASARSALAVSHLQALSALPVVGGGADDQHRDRGGGLLLRRSVAGAVPFPHDARPNCAHVFEYFRHPDLPTEFD